MAERRVVEVTEGGPRLAVDVYDAPEPRGAVLCVHGFASGRRGSKIEHLGRVLPAARMGAHCNAHCPSGAANAPAKSRSRQVPGRTRASPIATSAA